MFMREGWSNRGLPDIDPSVALVQAMRNEQRNHATFWQRREIASSIAARSTGVGKAAAGTRGRTSVSLLVLLSLLLGATSAFSQVVVCKPLLLTKAVREVRPSSPQALPWKWQATIVADTSFCATRSGNFEMDFVRIKEYSPDLQFTQTFRWSQKQFDVSMELSVDEAILEFRIGFIAPCVCRETSELLIEPREK
jgi:hypothetical protein